MSPLASEADRRPWRPADAAIAVVAGLVGSAVPFLLLGDSMGVRGLFGIVVPVQAVTSLLVVAWLTRRRTDWRTALSARAAPVDAVGILIGAGLQLGLSLLAYLLLVGLLGLDPPSQEVVDAAAAAFGWADRALVVLGVVVLGPLSEEVVFRGVLLGALRRRHSDRASVIISAVAFGALHLLDPNAVFAAPFLFVLGLVMGQAVVASGRLGRAVALHSGFNLVTVLALFTF